jgi:hypothetical protein
VLARAAWSRVSCIISMAVLSILQNSSSFIIANSSWLMHQMQLRSVEAARLGYIHPHKMTLATLLPHPLYFCKSPVLLQKHLGRRYRKSPVHKSMNL